MLVSSIFFFQMCLTVHSFWILDIFKKHNQAQNPSNSSNFITFKRIVDWNILFAQFMESANSSTGSDLIAQFPGVVAKGILCPPKSFCASIDVSFQPKPLALKGGICGVDFSPVPIKNTPTRLFLLPQLIDNGIKASEGARGIVISSSGYVFDLAGGCFGCISIYPRVGYTVFVNPTAIHRTAPVVVSGLHSHCSTYYHVLQELLPRLYMVMPYVKVNLLSLLLSYLTYRLSVNSLSKQ